MEALQKKIKQLDEKLERQAGELSLWRQVLIEVNLTLPLHAVRASRIALRSTELSAEERRLVLESLESKESKIRTQTERVRERNGPCPDIALREIQQAVADTDSYGPL